MTNKTSMTRTNVLETNTGPIVVEERWPRKDKNRGPPDLPGNFRTSRRVERSLNALQVLQLERTQYLLGDTLSVPLQFLHDSLPYMVQEDVNIIQAVTEDLWCHYMDKKEVDTIPPMVRDFRDEYAKSLPGKRYHFWPIDISTHAEGFKIPRWALIVLHLTNRPGPNDDVGGVDDPLQGPYNFLDSYTVLFAGHGRHNREDEDDIASMLLALLPHMGITVDHESHREHVWIPPSAKGLETWSSGLRVFEMVRIFLERLTESYCMNPHCHDPPRFWAAHCGWFNADAVRSNMIGMAATMTNRAMDNTTRIAIEPILDDAMKVRRSGRPIKSERMEPNRRRTGAFQPQVTRTHPTYIEDYPDGVEDEDDESDNDELEIEAEYEARRAARRAARKQ
ncbi:hypothetical protein F4808DRAFT_452462 [Astrocystis sublimbata]|nr:hypothetical protein F4808DRAFT_454394 [Astrocystis sublimbata]KAI0193525.1 hypothetical protein F4808DRAFT_464774 [Astrocystis sublimbata]KAI0197703.1 hypothetical protein F4808DRAFT_452462 [Astrocystis sublimbata]